MTALEHGDTAAIRAKFEELIEDLGPEAVTELAQSFVNDTPETMSQLREFTQLGDSQNLKRTAHSFKSIAQLYGLQEVGQLSQQIETASGNQEIGTVPDLIQRIQESYHEHLSYLIDLLQSDYQISLTVPEQHTPQPHP